MAEMELRESGPDEVDEVSALLERCFESNPKTDPAVMAWQYWSNPFGRTRSWVAVSKGTIVAHHSAYAVPMRQGARRFTAAIQVDTATDPAFRGRGLYGDLSRVLYASCRDDGVATMLGNPNEQALGPLRRVGWIEVADLQLFILPLDPLWVARRTGMPEWASRLGLSVLFRQQPAGDATVDQVVPAGLDELVRETLVPDTASVATGSAWWRWRFEQHPLRPYFFVAVRQNGSLRAAAACGTRTQDRETFVDVLDFVAASPSAARSAVAGASDAVPGASGVLMTTNANSPYADLAARAGLRRVPRWLRPNQTFFGILPLDGTDRLIDARWSVSLGTLDYA